MLEYVCVVFELYVNCRIVLGVGLFPTPNHPHPNFLQTAQGAGEASTPMWEESRDVKVPLLRRVGVEQEH